MPRTAAERLLDEFLQRIAALNEDSRFLARVERAIVFGSYLSGGDQLGDVDVAVHLVPRSSDLKKHREANYRRVAEEEQKGRRFRSFLYQAFLWEQETMLFLRNRHRGLSLQHYGSIREPSKLPLLDFAGGDSWRFSSRFGPLRVHEQTAGSAQLRLLSPTAVLNRR
jgi:hypothetical protein